MKQRIFLFVIIVSVYLPSTVFAQKTRVEITRTEDYPGIYGESKIKYEKVFGKFISETDPKHPLNKIITDIDLAQKNKNGFPEYTSEFFIVKPKDMSLSNGILRYDAPNRSNAFNSRPDSLLMARGYIFISAAWEGDVDQKAGAGNAFFHKLYLTVPIAKNRDGSEITGKIRVEFAPAAGTKPKIMDLCGNVYNSGHESYAPVSFPSNEGAILTRRINESDPRRLVPNSEWSFPEPSKIELKEGFDSDYIYELVYTGRNPKVMGLGLAAVRDIVSFFRDSQKDSYGWENPLYGHIKYTIGTGTSQSGNFMKTFLNLGFNEGLKGKRVFDAIFPIVASRQTNINMRFAVPGGGGGVRTEHRAYGQLSVRAFPADYYDEISGRKGGILERAKKTGTEPKIFMLLTASELWILQTSPLFTDAYGTKDLNQPSNLRIYYIAGAQHSVGLQGQVDYRPDQALYPNSSMVDGSGVNRALWIALEEWVTKGIEPPLSEIPTIKNKTLVFPEELKYPAMKGLVWSKSGKRIPDFVYKGYINNLSLIELGPEFNEKDESGISSNVPPAVFGKDYAIMVSQIDNDGNETGGILTPEILAPTGTNFGYNYDPRPYIIDQSGLRGAFIPFHKTKKERIEAGDERLSLEERYGTHEGYVNAVKKAAELLVSKRLLLPEDAGKIILKAQKSDILKF